MKTLLINEIMKRKRSTIRVLCGFILSVTIPIVYLIFAWRNFSIYNVNHAIYNGQIKGNISSGNEEIQGKEVEEGHESHEMEIKANWSC